MDQLAQQIRDGTVDLQKLSGANLEGADLQGADLQRANLEGANLKKAKLQGAQLQGANLEDINAVEAQFQNAKMTNAELSLSDLYKANFSHADLRNAKLIETESLEEAIFEHANLQNANLWGANLEYSNFDDANLQGADLTEAKLFSASFINADLRGANLSDADVTDANFTMANLRGTNLDSVNIEEANFVPDLEDTIHEPQGVAFEIHNAYNKIDMDEYVKLISEMIPKNPDSFYTNMNLLEFVNTKFTHFIYLFFDKEDKKKYLPKWNAIYHEMNECKHQFESDTIKIQIGKSIEFVFAQSQEFKDLYIKQYVTDNFHAYEGESDTISCIKGTIERFIILVGDTLYIECEGKECTEQQIQLLTLMRKVLNKNELTQEWAKEFLESDELKEMTPPERKQHYIDFMKEKYKKAGLESPENTKMIKAEAAKFDYAGGPFESLEFGGGKKRRKTRKTKKRGKKQTKRKQSKKQKRKQKRKQKLTRKKRSVAAKKTRKRQ